MILTNAIIISGTGCSAVIATTWLQPLQTACEKFGITTPNAIAAFLANVGVESEELTVLAENMNYSAQALANTWPARFATVPKAIRYNPNALAASLAYKPQQIANYVYANRMGNGDVSSGDGWKYRGQGLIDITGRQMYAVLSGVLGMDLIAHPEQIQQPIPGALSAAWFFSQRGCIAAANNGSFAQVVKLINGAPPDAANQGPLREARYKACLASIVSAGLTSVPAPTPEPLATPPQAPLSGKTD